MDRLADQGFVVLGGPLADQHHVVMRSRLTLRMRSERPLLSDPWSETHLHVDSIQGWSIRLDGRRS
jgi:hypothetical protein